MIEELRRFILVVNNGNLTRTAETVFITQSALSQSIHRLEKVLGTKLFVQKGKMLTVTTDGLAVAQIGSKILELWEKAKDAKLRQSIRPVYTIGMFDNAALRLGKYFQNTIQEATFDLELSIGISKKLFSELQLGILDMAICVIDKKNPLPKDILLIQTFTEELIPVTSKKIKSNLKETPFILYNKGSFTRNFIDEQFTKKGISPKVFAESTSVTFMKELALLGCGIALLPKNFVASELKQGSLKKQKLPIIWQRDYGIYIQKNGRLEKTEQMVKEIIKALNGHDEKHEHLEMQV